MDNDYNSNSMVSTYVGDFLKMHKYLYINLDSDMDKAIAKAKIIASKGEDKKAARARVRSIKIIEKAIADHLHCNNLRST